MSGRPVEAQIPADVLETIRIGREVNVRINDREDIDHARQELVCKLVSTRLLNHPPQKSRLIAPVGIETDILVEIHDIEKLLEQLRLLNRAVCPKRVTLLGPVSLDDHPKQ